MSLPVEQGGHPFQLESRLRRRFELNFIDLLYIKLHIAGKHLRGRALQPLPYLRNFDLVILDGHYLRTYVTPALGDPNVGDRHRLLISQIIIALRAVKQGGTLVVKLSHVESVDTVQLLYMLDILSGDLRTCKPRTIHGARSTFYAIAREFGEGVQGRRKAEFLHHFEALWFSLTYGGEEGRGQLLTDADLDFIVSFDKLVDEYFDRLVELGSDVWSVQVEALHRWFMQKGFIKQSRLVSYR